MCHPEPKQLLELFEYKMNQYSATCGECNDFGDAVSLAVRALSECLSEVKE